MRARGRDTTYMRLGLMPSVRNEHRVDDAMHRECMIHTEVSRMMLRFARRLGIDCYLRLPLLRPENYRSVEHCHHVLYELENSKKMSTNSKDDLQLETPKF